jgi:EAL domain-containing protein (putative c-di-GMP-specific phosphodiesterase class I)
MADVLTEMVNESEGIYDGGGEGEGLCCRINADTFAMLVEHTDEYNDEMFANLIAKITKQFGRCRLHVNFGIYETFEMDCSMSVACDRALSAVETIKGKYTKYFAYYDDTIRLQKLRDQAIADNMERALLEKQFIIYYQPKYSLKTGRIIGAEALVRWISPTEGFMSPGEFIPMFERNGFISQLDRYVWEEVCVFIRKCMDSGLPVIPVSANVSRADLYNPDLPETILGIVNKYKLDIKTLHLEITESAYTDQPEVIISAVTRLSEMGFVIEMDDFGTGYSSLNMLSELPIDVLKLDMKFVQSNTDTGSEKSIINFIIDLAKWMHLSVTAEGAETKEQVERLLAMDCDAVQGYYFSKPIPEADFIALLEKDV